MSPLGKNVSKNMQELYVDNMKSGKERGMNGKPRSHEQMVAIAMNAAGKSNHQKMMDGVHGRGK